MTHDIPLRKQKLCLKPEPTYQKVVYQKETMFRWNTEYQVSTQCCFATPKERTYNPTCWYLINSFICWCSRHNKIYCHESFCSIARSKSWMSRKSNFLKCFNPAHSLIRIPLCKVICNLLYSTLVSYQIIC